MLTNRPEPDPVVRNATSADLTRLGTLGALLVEEHHAFDERRFIAPWARTAEDYASFLGTHLDKPDAILLVAEDHGTVVGYAFAMVEGPDFLMLRGPAAVLHDIIVQPACRGRGVGVRLFEALVLSLQIRGVRQLVLSSAEKNTAAQRLFANVGFRRTMVEMTRELE